MNVPRMIILHHSAAPATQTPAIIDEYHKSIGFPRSSLGYYIGYQYLILSDGTIFQARKETEEGAHCKGKNFESVGICLLGNFDHSLPSSAQVASLKKLLREVCERWKIPTTEIYPHRKFAAKTCYGSRLDDKWGSLLAQLSTLEWIFSKLLSLLKYK